MDSCACKYLLGIPVIMYFSSTGETIRKILDFLDFLALKCGHMALYGQ